jgi:hypothetical protein
MITKALVIYYKETKEQKEDFAKRIKKLNKQEIKAECRLDFKEQKRLKEEK